MQKSFLLLTIVVSYYNVSTAQPLANHDFTENYKQNQTVQLKDKWNKIYAQGKLNGTKKVGLWKFYIAPESRNNQIPDVEGFYDSLGMKSGTWLHHNQNLGMHVKANYVAGMMQGECIYYDDDHAILARGLVKDGYRHGKWIFYDENSAPTGAYHKEGYKLNKMMTMGYYVNGLRVGKWDYDYYLDKSTHVKGSLLFENGQNSGRLEFYKVEHHDIFGTEEHLSGIGTFENNVKIGRWVVFNYGTKGDFIETGSYKNGKRDGAWKVRIGDQTHLSGYYVEGIPHGKSIQYYENGQIKYETSYNKGLEEGKFVRYYENGQIMEQGTHIIEDGTTVKDTQYVRLKLPLEAHFDLTEMDFQDMHYVYISWLEQAGFSIRPGELIRRLDVYRNYGKEAHKRIKDVKVSHRKVMRTGPFMAFYENGNLKLKGQNVPGITSIYNPSDHSIRQGFARVGQWKAYDEFKNLKSTYVYENGKLTKMLDGNGYVAHTIKYESNGSYTITDKDGHVENIK